MLLDFIVMIIAKVRFYIVLMSAIHFRVSFQGPPFSVPDFIKVALPRELV